MRTRWMLLVLLSVLLCRSESLAQESPIATLSAGYASVYDATAEVSYPAGWYASVSGNLSERLGLEFEVNQQIDSGFEFISLLAGPRARWPIGERLGPYARGLAGVVHYSRGTVAWNSGVVQLGAGLDVYLTDQTGVRVGGDVRWGLSGDDPRAVSVPPHLRVPGRRNAMRFTLGVVFGLGNR